MHSTLISYLLEHDNATFVLLPGTVEELYSYIGTITRKKLDAEVLAAALRQGNATEATVRRATALCEDRPLDKRTAVREEDLLEISRALTQVVQKQSFAIDRLESLLLRPNVISAGDIFPQSTIDIYDNEIRSKLYTELTALRQGYSVSNEVDAVNLATIVHHNQIQTRKCLSNDPTYDGHFIRLLTNTASLFKMRVEPYEDIAGQLKAQTLDFVLASIPHSFALRSIFEACVALAIGELYEFNYDICARTVEQELERVYALQIGASRLNRIVSQEKQAKYHLDIGRFQNVMTTFETLRGEPEKLVRSKWYQAIKQLLVVEGYESEAKNLLHETEIKWWEQETSDAAVVTGDPLIALATNDISCLNISDLSADGFLEKTGIVDETFVSEDGGLLARWTVSNKYLTKAKNVFSVDKFEDVLYASWVALPSLPIILKAINTLFHFENPHNEYRNLTCEGELRAVFGNDELTETLFELPLVSPIDHNSFGAALERIETAKEKGFDLPSLLWCDTNIMDVKFDVIPVSGDEPSVLFSYVDPGCVESMIRAFLLTHTYRGTKKYEEEMVAYIRNRGRVVLGG
jgi:hypothetical protein